jgi:hypothetical protein
MLRKPSRGKSPTASIASDLHRHGTKAAEGEHVNNQILVLLCAVELTRGVLYRCLAQFAVKRYLERLQGLERLSDIDIWPERHASHKGEGVGKPANALKGQTLKYSMPVDISPVVPIPIPVISGYRHSFWFTFLFFACHSFSLCASAVLLPEMRMKIPGRTICIAWLYNALTHVLYSAAGENVAATTTSLSKYPA